MIPLRNLHIMLTWSSSLAKNFDNLKSAFTSTPILDHTNLEKPFIIEMDASDFALGSILTQVGDY